MAAKTVRERTFEAVSWYVGHTLALFGVYRALFQSESNCRTLDAAGGGVFRLIQDVLADDIIRRLAALADPATHRRGKDKNLSIAGLLAALPLDPATVPGLPALVSRFNRLASRSVRYRHKCVAHIDQPTTIGDVPRPTVRLKDVLDSTACLVELMNAIQLAALNCTTSYGASYEGEASGIVEQLRRARPFQTLHLKHRTGKLKGLDLETLFRRVRGETRLPHRRLRSVQQACLSMRGALLSMCATFRTLPEIFGWYKVVGGLKRMRVGIGGVKTLVHRIAALERHG
jgi:hypothetical protein